MVRRLRTFIFWCHLAVAVPTALVILVMSVSGVLLGFQRQMESASDRANYAPAGNRPASAETVLLAAAKAEGRSPTSVTVKADPRLPSEARFGRGRTLFVDGATGRILGDGAKGSRGFFRGVTDWHRWLATSEDGRETGKAITGACNLAFLFLVLSGFYLWWPRNWNPKALRNSFLLRRGLKPKARDFNIHNAIGFWAAVPLALIVASGVVISYPWASALVFRAAGESPPQREERGGGPGRGAERGRGPSAPDASGLDALVAKAQAERPDWRAITVTPPREATDPVVLAVDRGTGGQPQLRENFSFERLTGALVKREGFGDLSAGRRARTFFRFAHTGEVGGLGGQIVATLASLGAAVLVWTGLALSWRRLLAWNARRRRTSGPETSSGLES